jgi:predicted dehydrogenase
MQHVRVGLIGCGQQATWIIHPSIRMIEAYDIVACCDAREEAAAAAGRRLGVSQLYTDYETMVARETLDAVVVVTTPENHAQIVAAALDANLHVFVEKPPVKTVAEALDVKALSDRAGKHVMVGFMMRFRPFNQHVAHIAESMAQPPALLQLSVSMGPARSKVTGYPPELYLLLSVGIHYFDLIRYFMGDIQRISVQKHSYNERQVAYAMMLTCDRGTCLFNLNSCERLDFTTNEALGGQVNERYHLVGAGESLYLENCEQLTWLKPIGGTEFYQPSHLALSFLPGQAYYQGGYYQEMQEFAQSVLDDRPPSVTIADGLKATQSVFAAYESAGRGGEWVDVPN